MCQATELLIHLSTVPQLSTSKSFFLRCMKIFSTLVIRGNNYLLLYFQLVSCYLVTLWFFFIILHTTDRIIINRQFLDEAKTYLIFFFSQLPTNVQFRNSITWRAKYFAVCPSWRIAHASGRYGIDYSENMNNCALMTSEAKKRKIVSI